MHAVHWSQAPTAGNVHWTSPGQACCPSSSCIRSSLDPLSCDVFPGRTADREIVCVAQVAEIPHQDISAREVEASVHLCEHLFYMQQTQRSVMSGLCSSQAQLDLHSRLMAEFTVKQSEEAGPGLSVLPPQVSSRNSLHEVDGYTFLNLTA